MLTKIKSNIYGYEYTTPYLKMLVLSIVGFELGIPMNTIFHLNIPIFSSKAITEYLLDYDKYD